MTEDIAVTRPMTASETCEFGSFWHGPLNPFAYACLASFARAGATLSVYSYNPRLDVPPGVRLADARAIYADESLVRRFIANGKPSIATFADMFRYKMIQATGLLLGRYRHRLFDQTPIRKRRIRLLPPSRRRRYEPHQQCGAQAACVAPGASRTRRDR